MRFGSKLLTLTLLTVFSMSTLAFANVNEKKANDDKPKTTLSTFLDAVKKGDVKKITSMENDSRISGNLEAFQNEMLSNQHEQLDSYTIENSKKETDSVYDFVTKLNFKDGSTSQIPFKVVLKDKKDWKVEITPDSLDNKEYVKLKEPKEKLKNEATVHSSLSKSNSQLATWSFQNLNGTIYGKQTFNVSGDSVILNLQQKSLYPDGDEANVEYAVVSQHWYGDDVWGSTNAIGNFSTGTQRTISGKSSGVSSVQMRFKKSSDIDNYKFGNNGFGEVYSN